MDGSELPSWFTPMRMLLIFTSMSLVVYLDRGLIASTPVNGDIPSHGKAGYGIRGDFALTTFEDGCLPAAFMVGLMAASPVFADLSKRVEAFRLVGSGLLVWVVAVAACAAAWDFWSLLVCRMAVGVGEASFVIFAAPFIDAYAPVPLRSIWIAIFLMAIPVGYALGYIYGGVFGAALGWRLAFLSEACFMLPLVSFAFCARPVPLKPPVQPPAAPREGPDAARHNALPADDTFADGPSGGAVGEWRVDGGAAGAGERANSTAPPGGQVAMTSDRGSLQPLGGRSTLAEDIRHLARSRVYVLAILGNSLHTAVLGMYAYWGPAAVTRIFQLPEGRADVLFGAITVATGVAGTLLGGAVLDALHGGARAAAAVCLGAVTAGFAIMQGTFTLASGFPFFCAAFAAGELALFALQAPVTRIILLSVSPELRPLAFSVQTIAIHVLGDVPSPPFAGWLHDHVFWPDDVAHPESWRLTALMFNCVLLGASLCFAASLVCTSTAKQSARAELEADMRPVPYAAQQTGPQRRARSGVGVLGIRKSFPYLRVPPLVSQLEPVEEGRSSAEQNGSSATLTSSRGSQHLLDVM